MSFRFAHVGRLAIALLWLVSCKQDERGGFERWTAGDRLFEGDAVFRGGDAAYSVDLGGDRIAWLFGDSFVGPQTEDGRQGLPLVRNAVAIQQGRDPATATMTFTIGTDPLFEHPSGGEDAWFWPGPAVRIEDTLVVGLAEIRLATGGLGFETHSSHLAFIDQPDQAPDTWLPQVVAFQNIRDGVQPALGAWLHEGDETLLFAPVEPGNHDVYLAKWNDASLVHDRNPTLTWWDGSTWTPDPARAVTVVGGVQTEFSVHRQGGEYWMVSVEGFGATDVVTRTAPAATGPWSKPRQLIRPPEAEQRGILIYSAKAHPALTARNHPGPLITYCTNNTDFKTLVEDMSLYFPRFVVPR